jgi:ABC-type amino acid transport substrate-binding protein
MQRILPALVMALIAAVPPALAAEKPLKVAVNYFFPPFSWVVDGKTLVGFDVELAEALCKVMDRDCKPRAVAPGDRVPGLMFKRFDILATPTSGGDPWTQAVTLSRPYCRTAAIFLAGPSFKGETPPEGLAGLRVGAKDNSAHEAWLKRHAPRAASVKTRHAFADILEDLEEGRIDLAFVPSLSAADFLNKRKNGGFRPIGEPISGEGLGESLHMAVRKEDKTLATALDAAIDKVLADGTHAALLAKYFPESLRAIVAPAPTP